MRKDTIPDDGALIASRLMRSRFQYLRKSLINSMTNARDILTDAIRRLESLDLDDDLKAGRLTIPINGLGVLQAQGPMIDNRCGALETLYIAIKETEELANVQ